MTPPVTDDPSLVDHIVKAAPVYAVIGAVMTGTIAVLGKFIGHQFVDQLKAAREEMEKNTQVTADLTAELRVIKSNLPDMVKTTDRHERELTSLHDGHANHEGRLSKIEGICQGRRKDD